jgi:hypothetical protein
MKKVVLSMSILDKYNKKSMFKYDNGKEREYINLQGLVNENGIDSVYTIHALFINTKSRYGDAPLIVIDDYLVNAPRHLLSVVEDMRNDPEVIELINKRKIGFKIYSYQGKNGSGFSVEWVQTN